MARSRQVHLPNNSGRSVALDALADEIGRQNDQLRSIGENNERFLHPVLRYANDAVGRFSLLANRQEFVAVLHDYTSPYNGKLPTIEEFLSLYLSLGELLACPVAVDLRHEQKLKEMQESEDFYLATTATILLLATAGEERAVRVHLEEIDTLRLWKVIAEKLREIRDCFFKTNVETEAAAVPKEVSTAAAPTTDRVAQEESGDAINLPSAEQTDEEKVCAYLKTQNFLQEKDPKKWIELIVQCTSVSATKINKMNVWQLLVAEQLKLWLIARPRATGTDVNAVFGFIPSKKLYLNGVWSAHNDQKRNSMEIKIQSMSDRMASAIPNDMSTDHTSQIDEREFVINSIRQTITDATFRATLASLSLAKQNELADHVLEKYSYADIAADIKVLQAAVLVGESWLDKYSDQHPSKDYRRSNSKANPADH